MKSPKMFIQELLSSANPADPETYVRLVRKVVAQGRVARMQESALVAEIPEQVKVTKDQVRAMLPGLSDARFEKAISEYRPRGCSGEGGGKVYPLRKILAIFLVKEFAMRKRHTHSPAYVDELMGIVKGPFAGL